MTSSTPTKFILFTLTTAGASSAMALPAASPVPSGAVVRALERGEPTSATNATGTSVAWTREDPSSINGTGGEKVVELRGIDGNNTSWARNADSNSTFWARNVESNSTFWARSVDGNSTFWARAVDGNSTFWARNVNSNSTFWARNVDSNTTFWARSVDGNSTFWARSVGGNSTSWARAVDGNSSFWARAVDGNSTFWARSLDGNSSFWAVRDTSTTTTTTTTTTTADPALSIQEKDTALATQQTTIVALSLVLAFVLVAPLVGFAAYRFNKRRLNKINPTSATEDTEKGVDPAALTTSQSVCSKTSVPPPVYGAHQRDSSWTEASGAQEGVVQHEGGEEDDQDQQYQLNHAGYV